MMAPQMVMAQPQVVMAQPLIAPQPFVLRNAPPVVIHTVAEPASFAIVEGRSLQVRLATYHGGYDMWAIQS